jgi:hypothetical protein
MRSSCYNFAAVTQAHKEMAKKRGLRPPRVTRFASSPQIRFCDSVTAETTSDYIQPIDSVEVNIIPDQSHVQSPVAVTATDKEIRYKQEMLDAVSIEDPLGMPYSAFNLPSTSTKSAKKNNKIARSSLKPKRSIKPTVPWVAVEDDITTRSQNGTKVAKSATDKSVLSVMDEVDSVTPSVKSASAPVKIATNTDKSSEKLPNLSDLASTIQEDKRYVEKGAQSTFELPSHSQITSLTTANPGDSVKVSTEQSSTTSAKSTTPVVSDVKALPLSTHQSEPTTSESPEGLTSPVPTSEVAKDSCPGAPLNHAESALLPKKYTGFNIAKSTDQRKKPAKAPRVSLKPNKRQPTVKPVEDNSKAERPPLQPRDLNRSAAETAPVPFIKFARPQEQVEMTGQIKTVGSLVSDYVDSDDLSC